MNSNRARITAADAAKMMRDLDAEFGLVLPGDCPASIPVPQPGRPSAMVDAVDQSYRRLVAVWQCSCIRARSMQKEALELSRNAYLDEHSVGMLNEAAKLLRDAANQYTVVAYEVRRAKSRQFGSLDPYFRSDLEKHFPRGAVDSVFGGG